MTRPRAQLFTAISCSLLIVACAESTSQGCGSIDWYRQGYADGTRTWASIIDQHTARCAQFGVKPDAAQYNKGFEAARWDVEHRTK